MSEYGEYIFFGSLFLLFVILLLAARKEELPAGLIDEEENTAGCKKPFGKAAVFLWKHFHKDVFRSLQRKSGGGRKSDEADNAGAFSQKDLVSMQKLMSLLLFGMLACVLGLLLTLASGGESAIGKDGSIARDSYDGVQKNVTVAVEAGAASAAVNTNHPGTVEEQKNELNKDISGSQDLTSADEKSANANKDQNDLGELVIEVAPRKYTQQETEELAQSLFTRLPDVIAGENVDLAHVNHPLNLVKKVEGYPFSISWTSADYELVDTNGEIKEIYEEDPTSETTTLTARLRYNGWHYEQTYPVVLVAIQETKQERLRRRIKEELAQSQASQESSEKLQLPTQIDGTQITWIEQKENSALLIFAIVLAAGVVNCLLIDRKRENQKEAKRKALRLEYPQLISKFVLFLGAGMSVRNVFYKLGSDYETQREAGADRKEVYEEILLSCRELDSGVSEAVVYGHFGQRCDVRQYNRLATLLVQDLRKGNSELLKVLQEEAQGAIQERRQMARTMGEEAGTKLLMPMVMMLTVTMVIIVVPAFMGFV